MLSHSSTQKLNQCPYAYKLYKIDGLVRTAYSLESNDRKWGIAMHAGVEAIHLDKTITEAIDAFVALYPEDLDPEDNVWTREGGIRTLQAYVEKYEWSKDQWEVLQVEKGNRDLGESEDDEGHLIIDLVTRHKSSGSIYFWDHKFTHRINTASLKRYELDAQLSRYASYVASKYGDCAGAIVNFICPGFRKRAYKGEPAGWHFRFEQNVYNRTKYQIDTWRHNQEQWERVLQFYTETNSWPKHQGWQCPRCDYYDVCFAEREGGGSSGIREAMYGGIQEEMNIEVEI